MKSHNEMVVIQMKQMSEDNQRVNYLENKMKSLEKFFYDQIENIHKAKEAQIIEFEKMLQEERAKARQCDVDYGTAENRRLREEQVPRFIDCQVTDLEEFDAERDKLIKAHEEKAQLKKEKVQLVEKDLELEKEFHIALSRLMEKHKPVTFQASSS